MIKIHVDLLSKKFNKSSNNIKYIVIHDTANTQKGAGAAAHKKYFETSSAAASYHYLVEGGLVLQCVLDKDAAWHNGKKYGKQSEVTNFDCNNKNSIGIGLCVNEDAQWGETVEAGVSLVKHLQKKYDIPSKNVIRHYDSCLKRCPSKMYDNGRWAGWHDFKRRLENKEENKGEVYKTLGEAKKHPAGMEAYEAVRLRVERGTWRGTGEGAGDARVVNVKEAVLDVWVEQGRWEKGAKS